MIRSAQIDALRAIAALLVLVAHASEFFRTSAQARGLSLSLYEISHAIDFGRIGVIIFFIISGFVVANSLDGSNANPAHFIMRRVFRLYPLYWLSIAGALLFLIDELTPFQLLANLTMAPMILGQEPFIGLYWTLETELFYYLFAILLFLLGKLRNPTTILNCIFFLILLFAGFMFGVIPAPTNLSLKSIPLNFCFMLIGALAYAIHSDSQQHGQSRSKTRILFLSIGLALSPSAYSLLQYFSTSSATDLRWALSYPTAVAIFFAMMAIDTRLTKPLAKFGLVSYSMYLMHPFALSLLSNWLPNLVDIAMVAGLPGAVILTTVLTALISAATYRAVELPFIRLSRHIAQ